MMVAGDVRSVRAASRMVSVAVRATSVTLRTRTGRPSVLPCLRARQACLGPFNQAGALELAQRAQDVQLEPAGGGREVEPFLQADERDARSWSSCTAVTTCASESPESTEPPYPYHVDLHR
jgi:hypothetical protein